VALGRNVAEELVTGQARPGFEPATQASGARPDGGEAASSGGMARLILRTFVENKLAVVGAAVLILMVLFCFVGPLFYKTNQTSTAQALATGLQNAGPSSADPLGTDASGFDILGRLMYGGQISLTVGFAAAGVATVVGVLYGAIAGFLGGWLDAIMMRFVDILLSVPILFLLITLTVMFNASLSLIILVIGGLAWLVPARLVRGETLLLRVREYVQAVRVMGGSGRRIVLRHIIPNAVGTIVVNATFQVADAILYLAALGFLGLGVQLPETDWGSMLNQGVDALYSGYWWQIYPAAGCIVLVVVALNFIGDALRDALEVRLQRR
jgi:peptide/nickel transport system permease protein